ncbi:MAG: hypothetical protein O2815_05115 [Actinomycetota bacterium]|nr:hypothetical protein [Actinomycetota bacterium]
MSSVPSPHNGLPATPPHTVIENRPPGRARMRILEGNERPDRTWHIGPYTIEVCGWTWDSFPMAYHRCGTPQADSWVAVTRQGDMRRLAITRYRARSHYVAVREAVGWDTYRAVRSARTATEIPLTEDIEAEILDWITSFDRRRARP